MSVVVKHKETNKKYVMIGTGYGIMRPDKAKFYGQYLLHQEDEKLMKMAAVCDDAGDIFWYDTDELQVVEIDDKKLETIKL